VLALKTRVSDLTMMITIRRVAYLLAFSLMCLNAAEVAGQTVHDSTRLSDPAGGVVTEGAVTIGGHSIGYTAIAGRIAVGATDSQDFALKAQAAHEGATANMFYVAYFKTGEPPGSRPITFIYDGGPGSASAQLHMMAFGPVRVVTSGPSDRRGLPYGIINNDDSLLDVSDLVFIDAPGTGFSSLEGPEAEKAFWGVDEDAHAFDRFVRRFLSTYALWNSPKYLLGESYGTTRSALLSRILQDHDVALTGLIQLSQNLNFDDSPDGPEANPGTEEAYYLSLPAMAAAAWYHHKLPRRPENLKALLREVEPFSLGEYSAALIQGADLPQDRKRALAEKLQGYTGISADYWLKVNLRLSGPAFRKQLLSDQGQTISRLDARYKGPDINPSSGTATYDPYLTINGAEFTAAINQYLRTKLNYGRDVSYKADARDGLKWNWTHLNPGQSRPVSINVMPDLAVTMIKNPQMKVMVLGGYFDLSGCTYFASTYQMKHLPIPDDIRNNISYHFFESGHMIYVNEPDLRILHKDISEFIRMSIN